MSPVLISKKLLQQEYGLICKDEAARCIIIEHYHLQLRRQHLTTMLGLL